MDTSEKLALPYILPSQAQKHVTHNEALRRLDAIVQLSCLSAGSNAAPPSPLPGERHLAGTSPQGEWLGHANEVAVYQEGSWVFFQPQAGWLCWDEGSERLLAWHNNEWAVGSGGANPVDVVGVNTLADTINRLSVKSDAALFSHDDVTPGSGDLRLVLNKAAPARTASLLYQSAWSGRAEIGLTGDDDISIKVSADGQNWHEAVKVDRASGAVSMPQTPPKAAGANGQLQFNSGGVLAGTLSGYDAANNRIGLGTPAPAHSLQISKLAADKASAAFAMTGWGRAGADPTDDHGVGLYLTLNQPGNRQFALCDTLSGNGVRFLGTSMDAITAFGQRADLTIGTNTNGAHVSSTVANTQFSVSNHAGSVGKVVCEIAGHLNQTGDLLRVTSYHFGTGGDALSVRADKSAVFGGTLRLASYAVASLPAAATAGAGALAFVPNAAGGASVAFSDGTNWRNVTDRSIITA